MSKKEWTISINDLRKWAQGQTFRMIIYTEEGKVYVSTMFHQYIQLVDKGQTIEYTNDEGDLQDISRQCLEDLMRTGTAYDSEYGIDYYTIAEWERKEREGEDL